MFPVQRTFSRHLVCFLLVFTLLFTGIVGCAPVEPVSVPTGDVSGGLSRATVQVGDRLYIFLGGMSLGSVPSGYELAGILTHQDSENLPPGRPPRHPARWHRDLCHSS